MTRIENAKCDNCGFEQKHIFIYGMGGIWHHLKCSCLKCRKIITYEGKIEKCPECGSKLIKLYEQNPEDEKYTCPNCGKRELRFYVGQKTYTKKDLFIRKWRKKIWKLKKYLKKLANF